MTQATTSPPHSAYEARHTRIRLGAALQAYYEAHIPEPTTATQLDALVLRGMEAVDEVLMEHNQQEGERS